LDAVHFGGNDALVTHVVFENVLLLGLLDFNEEICFYLAASIC
jgi:hypothetical protein